MTSDYASIGRGRTGQVWEAGQHGTDPDLMRLDRLADAEVERIAERVVAKLLAGGRLATQVRQQLRDQARRQGRPISTP